MSGAVNVVSFLGNLIKRTATTWPCRVSSHVTSELTSNGSMQQSILTRATTTLCRSVATRVTRLIRRCVNASSKVVISSGFAHRFYEITGSATITCRDVINRICAFRRRVIITSSNSTFNDYATISDCIFACSVIISSFDDTFLPSRLWVLKGNASGNSQRGNISVTSTYAMRGISVYRGLIIVASCRVLIGRGGEDGLCIFPSFNFKVGVHWKACRVVCSLTVCSLQLEVLTVCYVCSFVQV